ncbi:MAG: hypothetical protein FJ118_05935 [Deltaproteobacteria bacterium]|nr:hypothetical protein [Deltaproteobacteria bacterium]
MDFLEILKQKAFLGREFLTWLWFKSEQSGGRVELRGDSVVEVIFLNRLTLDLSEADTPQSVTIKGEHSELREGLAALREGKKIEETRVSLRGSVNEFTLTLKGTWLSFGSLRTPPALPVDEAEPEDEWEASFLEKISLVEEGIGLVDALFGHFLKLRLSPNWETHELPAIRAWVAKGEPVLTGPQ